MAISRDISERIKDLLQDNPQGLSITGIVRTLPINRNTASKYLDTLLVTGQVEMRHFGMAKIYTLSHRLPVTSVLSISSEYVLQVDQYFRVIFINAPFLDLLKISERDIVGKKINNTPVPVFFKEEYSLLIRWINEGLSGVERRGELALAARDRTFSCRVTPSVFTEGQKGVSVLLKDITAKKHDEMQIQESETRFRSIVEATTDGILVTDEEGRMIEWNNALSRITGIPRNEAIGATLAELMSRTLVPEERNPTMIENAAKELRTALRKKQSRHFFVPTDVEIVRPDGERRVIEQTLFPIETARGIRIGSVVHDITEQRRMLERLRQNESRLRSIIRAAPVGIGLVIDRVIREVNDRLCTMTGYPEDKLLGQSARMLYFSQQEYDRVGIEKYAQMAEEGTGSIETRWRKKDGGAIDILLSSTPLDPADLSLGVIFTVLDITRRKESERASSSGEERYRQLIERSFNAVIVHKNEKIILANDAACVIAGVQSKDELIGQPVVSFVHPDCRRLVAGRMKKMLAKPGTAMPLVRQTFCRKSGEPVDVEVMATSFLDNGTPAIQVIFREITDRVKQETQLKESEERYRTLAESAADMIYITDCNGNLIYANTLCARMYGCMPADLVGRKQTDLFLPEIARRHLAYIRKVVTTGEPVEHEEEMTTPAGTFRIDIKLSPILSPNGSVVSVMGIARNITARGFADPKGTVP